MTAGTFSAQVGKKQFLELFVTQLKHQNPLEPVKQEDFLQQLAQFSSVEGIENLNSKFDQLLAAQERTNGLAALQSLNSGAQLLGRTVQHGTEPGNAGVVTSVEQSNGQVLLRIGQNLIPVADVVSISDTPASNLP